MWTLCIRKSNKVWSLKKEGLYGREDWIIKVDYKLKSQKKKSLYQLIEVETLLARLKSKNNKKYAIHLVPL